MSGIVRNDRCNAPAAVPSCYNRDGRRNWHQRRRIRAILSLLSHVRGSVLDYGCGYGDITYEIAKTHPVRGVDVDTDRIAFATRQYAPIPFDVCPPDRLPFTERSFDIVLSCAVIHFVPDPAAHLDEIRRVLRDPGFVLLVCSNVLVVQRAISRLLGRRTTPPPMRIMDRSEVAALLDQAGFDIEADTYFYEPPFVSWRNPADVLVGSINQIFSLLHVKSTCGYFLMLARKRNSTAHDG